MRGFIKRTKKVKDAKPAGDTVALKAGDGVKKGVRAEKRENQSNVTASGSGSADRYGLKTLWPKSDDGASLASSTNLDIVAIHGLNGDLEETWTDRASGHLWLRDFLSSDVSDAHIMTFGYNSGLAFNGSVSRIDDFAISLLNALVARRRRTNTQGHPLVFVCHSLGGIVFKKALVIAHERLSQYGELLALVKGVMFLGTPHRGSNTAYWGKILGNLAKLPMTTAIRTDLLQELRPKSETLGNICSQFVERQTALRVVTVYERQKTKWLNELVVDEDSAVLNWPNEIRMPIEADHIGMCKFRSSESNDYELISDAIHTLCTFATGQATQLYDQYLRNMKIHLRAEDHDPFQIFRTPPFPLKGTNEWIFQSHIYNDWLAGPCHFLWIHAPPGSGKTVLAKQVVKHMIERTADEPIGSPPTTTEQAEIVVWHFFSGQDHVSRSLDYLIKEVFYQIMEYDPNLLVHLPKIYRSGNRALTQIECLDCLVKILQNHRGPCIRIVIDAVDEANKSRTVEFFDWLACMLDGDRFSRLRILVTSRSTHSEKQISSTPLTFIELDKQTMEGDVGRYVETYISRFARDNDVPYYLTEEIKKAINNLADGIFLHAKLAIDNFLGDVSLWSAPVVRERLLLIQNLSPGLESLYCELLSAIPKDFVYRARLIFAMIRFAHVNISVKELQYLITIDESHGTLDKVRQDLPVNFLRKFHHFTGHILVVREHQLDATGTTRELHPSDTYIKFYHQSARDLFDHLSVKSENALILSRFHCTEQSAHHMLATACLRMICLEGMQFPGDSSAWYVSGHDDENEVFMKSRMHIDRPEGIEIPLLRYALRWWPFHARRSSSDTLLAPLIVKWVLSADSQRCKAWRTLREEVGGTPPLHLLQRFGDFPAAMELLMRQGHDPNEIRLNRTVLHDAIRLGRIESMTFLLSLDDTSLSLPHGQAGVLHWAVSTLDRLRLVVDPSSLVEKLIADDRLDINATDSSGETALHWFLRERRSDYHSEAAMQVWKAITNHPKVNLDIRSSAGVSIFAATFRSSLNQQFALDLLNRDDLAIDLAGENIAGSNVMMHVDSLGWLDVQAWIFRNQPLQACQATMPGGFNALTMCAYMGRKQQLLRILDVIYPSRHNLPTLDSDSWTLLDLCLQQDWEDVASLLMKAFDARPSSSDQNGRTVLHWMVDNGWAMTSGLADEGQALAATIDIADKDGQTALHVAAAVTHVEAASWLIQRGASYQLRDKVGRTAVHLAADCFSRSILEIFLDLPTREFGRDKHGRSLLHYLAKWSDGLLLTRFCVRKKFLIDVKDRDRRTPLHYAALCSNNQGALALILRGASINLCDSNSSSALHYALRNRNSGLISILLEHGAETSTLDRFDRSCLQLAIAYGNRRETEEFFEERTTYCPRLKDRTDRFGRNLAYEFCRAMGNGEWDDGEEAQTIWINRMIRSGAAADVPDIFGRAPLHNAVLKGDITVVRILLCQVGVSPSPKDLYGCSPLDWAQAAGFEKATALLREYGAANTADRHGQLVMRSYWQPNSRLFGLQREDRWPITIWDPDKQPNVLCTSPKAS